LDLISQGNNTSLENHKTAERRAGSLGNRDKCDFSHNEFGVAEKQLGLTGMSTKKVEMKSSEGR
jgi:hypothetical protein